MRPKMMRRGGGSGGGGGGKHDENEEAGKMFVGGLSWETDQASMLSYFSHWGEVVDCVVMKNNDTGRSRGFGFVTFADPDNVQRVLADGPHELDGRTIDPKACNPRSLQNKLRLRNQAFPKVFLGGLPPSITETELRKFFGQFGRVMEVVIMYDQEKRKSRGFGFLSFDTDEAVDRALSRHFVTVCGKQVEVKLAEPRDGQRLDGGPPGPPGPPMHMALGGGGGGDAWRPPPHHQHQPEPQWNMQPAMPARPRDDQHWAAPMPPQMGPGPAVTPIPAGGVPAAAVMQWGQPQQYAGTPPQYPGTAPQYPGTPPQYPGTPQPAAGPAPGAGPAPQQYQPAWTPAAAAGGWAAPAPAAAYTPQPAPQYGAPAQFASAVPAAAAGQWTPQPPQPLAQPLQQPLPPSGGPSPMPGADPYGRLLQQQPAVLSAQGAPAGQPQPQKPAELAWQPQPQQPGPQQQYPGPGPAGGYPGPGPAADYGQPRPGAPPPQPQPDMAHSAPQQMGYVNYGGPPAMADGGLSYAQPAGPGPQRGGHYNPPMQAQLYHPYRHSPYPARR